MDAALCTGGRRRRENGNDFQIALTGIPKIVDLASGDEYRVVLMGGLDSTIEDQIPPAIDNEQDFVGFLVFFFAKLSPGWNAHHHQFTEGSFIDRFAKDEILVCELLDVVEGQNHRIRVPTFS